MKIFEKISGYYNKLIDENGYDPRSCDYGHPASQQIKFKTLGDTVDFTNRKVLDVGCGFADFSTYLESRFEGIEYTGVDLSESMVKIAKENHPKKDIRKLNILEESPSGRFDIVTANGIFYLLGEEAEQISKEIIKKMFEIADELIIFNSLSSLAPNIEQGEYYADPAEMLRFCQQLSPWVVLRHDYHPNDFTITIYKNRQS